MSEQPIQQAYIDQMRALAETLDEIFNGKLRPKVTGFTLLVFPFGDSRDGRVNYISNADRPDMLNTMKEFIARAEGRITDKEQLQ